MIRLCDLSFVENSILTREMLIQMNQEPKWLFLADYFRDVGCGVISGFEFINNTIDDFSILTKGNLIIDGKWYRMEEDFIFNGQELESGNSYHIVLKKVDMGSYEIEVLGEKSCDGIKFARFKYEYSGHKRAFRVPDRLEELKMKNALIHDIAIPYYNNFGVAVCPPHIAVCIKNSLGAKRERTLKEEIIFQRILNEKNVSIASILDLVGMTGNPVLLSDDMIVKLENEMSSGYHTCDSSKDILTRGDSHKSGPKNNTRTEKKMRGSF